MKRRKTGKMQMWWNSVFLSLVLISLLCLPTTDAFEERRCGTLDIRNSPTKRTSNGGTAVDHSKHLNCTVLEGSFLMSMILNSNISSEHDFPKYEHLREITGALLIFQVKGLRSLKWILPNLRVIGGQNLIQHYSLIVYQNDDMEELGLDNLRVIRNGGVRIADNPKMCFSKSIDWKRIQMGPVNDLLVDEAAVEIGVGEGQVAPCSRTCSNDQTKWPPQDRCYHTYHPNQPQACWSKNVCQLYCAHDVEHHKNGTVFAGPGCSDNTWERCHEQCVSGCKKPNDASSCYACANVNHNGTCVAKCPPGLYSHLDRRCISKAQCEALPPRGQAGKTEYWKAVNDKCHFHCPDKFEEDPNNKSQCRPCVGECHRVCPGNMTVDSLSKAKFLSRCSIIDGYLEVEMRIGMELVPAEEITKAFSRIQTIDGYLLIRFTPAFINLNMFQNLKNITGRRLYREKYALSVYENPNLQKLFPNEGKEPNIHIGNGYLQFHNNPMLCFRHIESFMKALNRSLEMEEIDQSSMSNGVKAICEESSFEVFVDKHITSSSFSLYWEPYSTVDIDYRKFLGYEVLYKEVKVMDRNMSIDDDRSACADSWSRYFKEVTTSAMDSEHPFGKNTTTAAPEDKDNSTSQYVYVSIATEYIKPDTLYAFYVTTSLVRHPGAHNAVSKIGFVRTAFGSPEPPKILKLEARGTDRIFVQWEPPARPNGQITHYVVSYREWEVQVEKRSQSICETQQIEDSNHFNDDSQSTTTPATSEMARFLASTSSSDVCMAKGCCACPANSEKAVAERQEGLEFENSIQNLVFVQQATNRSKRSISTDSSDKDKLNYKDHDSISQKIDENENSNEPARVNVTNTSYTITGLKHYTKYFVSILACQNVSVESATCSNRKVFKYVYTDKIESADIVDNNTISVTILNGTHSDMVVNWDAPPKPNGAILAYRVKITNMAKQATPIDLCKANAPGWSPKKDGVLFEGLGDGDYRVEVRTVSLIGVSAPSTREELFTVYVPGFWTLQKILLTLFLTILFLAIIGILGYYYVRKYYGKKVKEYATQLISANPEYLSQNDVYKPDQWELARDLLEIGEEIGRGTFGKVYRGRGMKVTSVCGETFGVCAIKTVAENTCSAERLHFLLEASVMKQFNSSFIVKLYGVVSDGQPVLVVMEMMEKGNLRDYLRTRRPQAEENIENLPVPHLNQYYEWAAQIADGMAYLESLRFCHRDLAARNCMVHANETVKIGDFGMARDLYYHEYYKPTGKRLMPVRWMSPESLKDGKFDTKSDVWSYGIVLYEMLTLGQQPYQGLANDEVLSFIGMSRKILDKPMDCPDFWYDLMVECWKYQPKERPNFYQIVNHLLPYVAESFKKESFVVNNPDVDPCLDVDDLDEGGYATSENPVKKRSKRSHNTNKTAADDDFPLVGPNRASSDNPRWEEGDHLAPGDVAEHSL